MLLGARMYGHGLRNTSRNAPTSRTTTPVSQQCSPVLQLGPNLLSQLDSRRVLIRCGHDKRLARLRADGIGDLTGAAIFQRQHDRFADVEARITDDVEDSLCDVGRAHGLNGFRALWYPEEPNGAVLRKRSPFYMREDTTMKRAAIITAGVVVVFAATGSVQAQVSPGDMNCDGTVDGLDIPLFVDCLLNGNCDHCGVVIETVTVGNPGNAGELSGEGAGGWGPDRICGAVDYVYDIGTYEVTAGQYTAFLNAVAATDTYGLYNTSMWASSYGCKIERGGSSGSYAYGVAADWADRPVNYVSWGDAARFANWLHNGQPTGAQDLSTTEDGSYFLNGAMTNAELLAITREPDATWVIPSEDEWYKAAYHKDDGATGNYWDYPTKSNTAPTSEVPPGTDMMDGSANYYDGGYTIGAPYYRTEVGAYSAKPSDSPYRTFDQGGNVWEWNEAILYNSARGLRGGSFDYYDGTLRAAGRDISTPTYEYYDIGFRVAEVPPLVTNLVRLTTSMGDILLDLVDDAPITTENFIQYVEDGFYDPHDAAIELQGVVGWAGFGLVLLDRTRDAAVVLQVLEERRAVLPKLGLDPVLGPLKALSVCFPDAVLAHPLPPRDAGGCRLTLGNDCPILGLQLGVDPLLAGLPLAFVMVGRHGSTRCPLGN